jgi:hypothetical protein
MKPARLIILFLIIFCCLTFESQAQMTSNKSGGTIAGRITAHGKGLPGVTVILRSAGVGAQAQDLPQAKTDNDGNYRLTGIPMGNYIVTPVAPVYTVPGAGRLTAASESIVITGSDAIEGIDFSLVPGGVITGRVTDTNGRPLIEQSVSLQNVDQSTQQGGLRVVAPGNFRTDDRGVYRIYGVPEGHYIVSVGAQQRLSAYATINGQQAYQQTFHPDTTDSTQATVVEVAEGAEVSNVDITVGRPIDEYAVTGRVIDNSTNAPVPNVGFTLSVLSGGGNRQRAQVLMALPIVSDSNGQFRIDNVPPGRYQVSLLPQMNTTSMWGQSQQFDVINQDVTGVEVRAMLGANLSGVVMLDGNQDPNILAELMQFQASVVVQPPGSGGGGFGGFNGAAAASAQTIPLSGDGSFQFSGLPSGSARLFIIPQDTSLQGAFKILRIERDGTQQQRGIAVNSGDQITGVRIVAAYADGTVQGVVKFQNGTPTAGTRIFARLSATSQTRGGNLGIANVDQRGNFLIQNVPPGTYMLTVSASASGRRRGGGQQQQPISTQQQITISEGQITNVTVSLDMGQTAPPTTNP